MNAKETIEAGKLMQAFGEEWERTGERPTWCEYEYKDGWGPVIGVPLWSWESGKYRRRPDPKLVPFTADDITPGMQFRQKGQASWVTARSANDRGLWLPGVTGPTDYYVLLQSYECRAVGETEWRPCGKVVES